MRRSLALITAMLGFSVLATGTLTAEDKIEFPKGHERFLGEFSLLMRKYPQAAQRFSLRDNSGHFSEAKRAHRACCEWSCPWHPPGSAPPRECKCNMQCPE